MNVTKQDVDSCCVPIKANFSKCCVFGQCSVLCKDWNDRIDHIADHFKLPWKASDWRKHDEEEEVDEEEDSSEHDQDYDVSNDEDGFDEDDDDEGYGLGPSSNGRDDSNDDSHDRSPHALGPRPGAGPQTQNHGSGSSGMAAYRCHTYTFLAGSIWSGVSPRCWQPSTYIPAELLHKILQDPRHLSVDYSRNTTWTIDIESVGTLGHGSEAKVDEVRFRGVEWTVARKVIQSKSSHIRPDPNHEAYIMGRFRHPNIAHLVAFYADANSTTIFMLPVADCNLAQYLSACTVTSSQRAQMGHWFQCLASAVKHVHDMDLVHGDIKASNILIKNDGVFVTDFGSSKPLFVEDWFSSKRLDFTERYAAPEVYHGERGRPADIFALGICFLEIYAFLVGLKHKDFWRERPTEQGKKEQNTKSSSWATDWIGLLRLRATPFHSTDCDYDHVILECCQEMLRQQPGA